MNLKDLPNNVLSLRRMVIDLMEEKNKTILEHSVLTRITNTQERKDTLKSLKKYGSLEDLETVSNTYTRLVYLYMGNKYIVTVDNSSDKIMSLVY